MPNQYLLDKQFFMAYLCALRCSVTIQGVPELVTRLAASALLTPRRKVDDLGTLKKSGEFARLILTHPDNLSDQIVTISNNDRFRVASKVVMLCFGVFGLCKSFSTKISFRLVF